MALSSATDFDDVERNLPICPEGIEPSQQPFQCQSDAAGTFGAVKRLDVSFIAIAFHRPAQAHDQIDDAVEAFEFIALGIKRLRIGPRKRE